MTTVLSTEANGDYPSALLVHNDLVTFNFEAQLKLLSLKLLANKRIIKFGRVFTLDSSLFLKADSHVLPIKRAHFLACLFTAIYPISNL